VKAVADFGIQIHPHLIPEGRFLLPSHSHHTRLFASSPRTAVHGLEAVAGFHGRLSSHWLP
jgi:hypothetical protein